MRSNAPRNLEEAASLDESTYEVVGMSDSLYETSDDEGHTASVASTTPDDVSVLTDDDDEDDDDDDVDVDDDDDFEQEPPHEAAQQLDNSIAEAPDVDAAIGGDESTLTEVPYMTQSDSQNPREFQMQEEGRAEQRGTDAWAVTKECLPEQATDGVWKPYGCYELRLTARAALSASHLPVRNSFKILFAGKLPAWAKEDIESHIGKALKASPGPSRSILRDGQLEAYGPVISSDHCKEIKSLDDTGKTADVVVTFDDGMQLTFGTSRKYSSTESNRVPDLVVFWYPHPHLSAPEVDDFPVAYKAFDRQKIPCLHVAEARRFHHNWKEPVDNSRNLRVCVEGKKTASDDFELQETLPVDIYTLQNLDPSQLNRHLAALDPRTTSPTKSWIAHEITGKSGFKSLLQPQGLSLFALALSVLSMILATYFVPGFPSMVQQAQVELSTSKPMSISTPIPPPASITSASAVSSITSAPAKVTPRELTVVSPPLKQSPHRPNRKEEKSAGFDIQTTSEHQFVLVPTRDFVSRKGKPQLQIQVSKDAESIPIRYTRTMQGAYIVDLEQEYPLSRFNVSIATHSKPLMQQSFAISMGHNKTMVAQLFDLVKRDVAATQEGLKKFYGNKEWKKQVESSGREAQELAKRQLATSTSFLREVSADTWVELRKATAPFRTSKAAHRARDNAFQIRCRVEEAVGLSSTKVEGKKSRSCEHIGR